MGIIQACKDLIGGLNGQAQQERLLKSVATSPLFKLPPEIRNMIYRYAIVTKARVRITKSSGIPEPALLSTCKILRSEACAIVYLENTFRCEVRDHDPASLSLAYRKFKNAKNLGVSSQHVSSVQIEVCRRGSRNWKNLIAWYHSCLQRTCCGVLQLEHEQRADAEERLLVGVFKIVCSSPKMTSSELDFVLESLRPVLVELRQDWGKD